jgi:hypothetical protein
MKYLLQYYYKDEYLIVNDDADYQAGRVRPLQAGLAHQNTKLPMTVGKWLQSLIL